jgi:sigma-B regulation protein RsbU (phosphoserine phosphatase)
MASHALPESTVRGELLDRKERLRNAIQRCGDRSQFEGLLQDVDAALQRLESGNFGVCQGCHEAIEADRLAVDPLITRCLDCLTEAQRRHLQMDLERAALIQNGLLPSKNTAISGWEIHYHYQPAGPVSGDFCDVISPASPDGEIFFLLGDVSGKGVSASILMSHLQAIFRGLVNSGEPLVEIASTANRMFCESTLPGHFATAVFGRAGSTGAIELLGAGHCASLLRSGGDVQILPAEGLPLGLFCEGNFRSRQAQLSTGDALMLFTDGLQEARNVNREEYGLDRIKARLQVNGDTSAEAIVSGYVEEIDAFRDDSAERDDLTIMAIRRTS